MKKKLLTVLSLVALFTASAFGVGCGESNSGTSDAGSPETSNSASVDGGSESNGGTSEEVKQPSITLSESTLSIEAYASATLTATLENSEATIAWSSSDESVAKVVDGVVTAYKAGTATITATAGTVSAACQVTVTAATESPVFTELPETLTIIKGSYEELDATLIYKGSEFTMATITYTTEGDVVNVNEEGVVVGAAYGTQDVVVKAFVGTEEIASKTISVTVIEYGVLIVDLEENTLELTVGDEGFSLSEIQVQLNGAIVEDAALVAESEDDLVATVEGGKIIAVGYF